MINSIEALIERQKIDFNVWEIVHQQPVQKPHLVQLFSITLRLKKKQESLDWLKVRKTVLDEIRTVKKPRIPKTKTSRKARHALELGLADVHLGKLAFPKENHGLDHARSIVEDVVDHLFSKVADYDFQEIILPWGNDFFHIDNDEGQTTRGTYVDRDAHKEDIFRTGFDLTQYVIRRSLEIAERVHVIIVGGNHDKEMMSRLGSVLEAYYHDEPRLKIDNRPLMRKYHLFGRNLIGYCHGYQERIRDLPLLMPVEAADMWAKSDFREFHLAHQHRQAITSPLHRHQELEEKGVVLRWIPSITPVDRWHHDHGFLSIRRAVAFVYDPMNGLDRISFFNIPIKSD